MRAWCIASTGASSPVHMEKPITPEKLVNAILEILDVEAEEVPPEISSEREELMQMIQQTDEDTLKEITGAGAFGPLGLV